MQEESSVTGLAPGRPGYRSVLFALAAGGFITFSGIHLVQPLLPVFSREWEIGPVLASLSVSLTILALAGSLLFYGALSDRIGRKRLIVWTSLLAVVPTMLAAAAPSFPWLLAARVTQGLFFAGLPAVAMAYVGEEVSGPFVGTVLGLYISGTSIGGMGGRIISGAMNDWLGWRSAFIALGLTTLAGALLMMALLPDSRQFQSSRRSPLKGIRSHLTDARLWRPYVIGFSWMFPFVGMFNYIGYYLGSEPFRLSPGQVGLLFLTYLSGTVSAPVTGKWIRHAGYAWTARIGTVFGLAGLLLTGIPSLWVIIGGLLLFCIGFFTCHATASSFVSRETSEGKASATALYLTFYYIGASIGSTTLGVFWTHYGWTGVQAGAGMSLLLALAGTMGMKGAVK